jgi:predicted ATP-binding protein involved in virulence
MKSCKSSSPIDCIEWFADRIAELEKENAELKAENQKWKDEWQEQVQKATDEGYARTLQTMQLTKAKELLRYYFDCFKNDNKYTLSDFEVVEDTEQFLSEVEK